VIDLIAAEIVNKRSKIASQVGLTGSEDLKGRVGGLGGLSSPSPPPSFLLQAVGPDRNLHHLNTTLQLLMATDPLKVTGLVQALGVRHMRSVSLRWELAYGRGRNGQVPELVHILMAKAAQLGRIEGCTAQASHLVSVALGEMLRSGCKDRGLEAAIKGEQLMLEHKLRSQVVREMGAEGGSCPGPGEELLARTVQALQGDQACLPSPALATSCLLLLLNCGDWEAVGRLSHTNMPYILAARNSPHAALFLLARHTAFLMLNLRTNSHQMIKKFGRDVWDTLATLTSTAAGKRQKDVGGGVSPLARERAIISSFLQRLEHHSLLLVVLSLLASLHNVARDDPNTDIVSVHASVWPTGLATNSQLQERQLEEMLSTLLNKALVLYPQDAVILRMQADLQFSANRHSGALAHYTESTAVRTDFFQLDCGPPTWLLEEATTQRMLTSSRELGRLMQAVVLSQFSQEPNYAQAFKFLEDQTEDGSDSLYGCIWDMAILEFAMSLHTKRGEVARRRSAKHCIWQLELNTNNDEEILNEAANVRKAMFLRSLAGQFF